VTPVLSRCYKMDEFTVQSASENTVETEIMFKLKPIPTTEVIYSGITRGVIILTVELGNMWKEMATVCFKILSRRLTGGIRRNP